MIFTHFMQRWKKHIPLDILFIVDDDDACVICYSHHLHDEVKSIVKSIYFSKKKEKDIRKVWYQ